METEVLTFEERLHYVEEICELRHGVFDRLATIEGKQERRPRLLDLVLDQMHAITARQDQADAELAVVRGMVGETMENIAQLLDSQGETEERQQQLVTMLRTVSVVLGEFGPRHTTGTA